MSTSNNSDGVHQYDQFQNAFDFGRFATEIFVTSLASGAVGGAASALIGSGGSLNSITRPAVASGSAIALSTVVAETVHTALDRYDMNPLEGASMLIGPGLTGAANVVVNNMQLVRTPRSSAAMNFVVGAGAEVVGRYAANAVLPEGLKQLPKK